MSDSPTSTAAPPGPSAQETAVPSDSITTSLVISSLGFLGDIEIDAGLDKDIPIGDTHFKMDGIKIGYEICEDAWVAARPGTSSASKGVDIYMNPSASHFSFRKIETRKNFVTDGS